MIHAVISIILKTLYYVKEPDIKHHIVYDSVYIKYIKKANLQR